jgi:hypothetical protein
MVKVGFVVEGPSEKRLIDSANFQDLCTNVGLEVCRPIIVIGGVGDGGRDITGFIRDCRHQAKPEKVLVLVDLENAPCFQVCKEKLGGSTTADAVVIARRTLEAWFMADAEAFAQWTQDKICIPFPELEQDNFLLLAELAKTLGIRGPGVNHDSFARTMNNKYNFSLERAALHPHCPSAAYFLHALAKTAS